MNWFKKHKILTAVLIVIIIGVVIGGGSGDNESANTNTANNQQAAGDRQPQNSAQAAKIGETARDGKFEFTVAGVECGKASAGTNQYLTKQAQGQFCFVNVTVKNIGSEAQTFDSSSQYLYDAANAKFSADGTASLYANPEASTFLNQINPGNSVSGILVFDLPKDKTPTVAELHDSPFSGGVKVSLQ